MMQSISRLMNLSLGTQIGLFGDYNAPSTWGEILGAKVSAYVEVDWKDRTIGRYIDVGLLATREEEIVIPSYTATYIGKTFLLLHRYPDAHWDHSDPNVFVYGLPDEMDMFLLSNYDRWFEGAVWLSAAATMCILEKENMSEMAKVMTKRYSIF